MLDDEPPRRDADHGRRVLMLVLGLPFALFLALHLRTLHYGFVWTDEVEIVQGGILVPLDRLDRAFTEPQIGDVQTGGKAPYYRPLQMVLVSVLHAVAGETPWVYRLVSLMLGALTMSLFSWLVWQWLGRAPPAIFAAALPALHPAGLEVYVWIAGLSAAMVDLLSIAGFACAAFWIRKAPRPRLLIATGVLYALALSSKESGVVLGPLVLALVAGDAVAGRPPEGRALRIAGFRFSSRGLVLAAVLGAIAVLHIGVLREAVIGADTARVAIGGSRLTHVLSAVSSWPGSLGWMLLPWWSNANDAVAVVDRITDVRPWLGAGLLGASVTAWFVLARARLVVAALGVAWIWIAFLPTANLVPNLHAVAERYVFLSTFGWALLLVGAAPVILPRLSAPALLAPVLGFSLLGFLAERTWTRAPAWTSSLTLFERDVAAAPDYREGRQWLAASLLREGRTDEAIAHLEILLDPATAAPGRWSYAGGDPRKLYCQALSRSSDPSAALRYVDELSKTHPKRASSPVMQDCVRAARAASKR